MFSNSKILTTSIFGSSSSDTSANLIQKNTSTIELIYKEQVVSKLNNRVPRIPSNQKKARD